MFVGDACARCRRADNCLDVDISTIEGAIALCVGCISDLANAAGLHVNDARVRELEGEVETLKVAKADTEALLARIQAAMRPSPRSKAAR